MIIKAHAVLNDEMLGTKPVGPAIFEKFIAEKKREYLKNIGKPEAELDVDDENELQEKLDAIEQAGFTCFHRDADECPIIWDYQVKGFFKGACGFLRRVKTTESAKLKAYKQIIDGLIFVTPRKIKLNLQTGTAIATCERSLRVETMRGPRVCLAKSESVPEGTRFDFDVELLDDGMENAVMEWFDYARKNGLGQWRNGGKGRCEITIRNEFPI